MKIEVYGNPLGKERPRATSFGGHARIYTPKKTQSYEAKFASKWVEEHPQVQFKNAIEVVISAYFPLLKGDYKKDGSPTKSGLRKINGEEKPTKKPDLDNIAKAVLDGLNGVAFVDDSQVVRLIVDKHYAEQPKVVVWVNEL